MKTEEIIDMIGEAPDHYIKDAKTYKKRRIPRWSKWLGGIAAALAVVLLVNNVPEIPLIISAKAVSVASTSRKLERPKDHNATDWQVRWDAWRAQENARQAVVKAALPEIAEFAGLVSGEVLSGTDGTNRVWSPINAYIALAMMAELTGGETQAQVLDVLGAAETDELRSRISAVWEEIYADNGKEISVLANSLWLDEGVGYVQETMDILARDYYASVYRGDLGSPGTNRDITNWMRNQTGGMLKDRTGNVQLDPEDQIMIAVSTIYFQSKWADEFNRSNNTQGVFHAATGDVECTFMNKKEYHMNYYWGEDFGAVQMSLENGSSMWFILPDEGKTVDDVLASDVYMQMITQQYRYTDEEENCKWMKVNLSVPQFDVSAGIDVKQGLQNIGLTHIFDPTVSDFSPAILPSEDFNRLPYVASIHQDTRVTIDEEGVAAASYIEIVGAGAAEPPDEIIDFILDRPFVFAVTKSRIPLFVGTVNMP